MRTMREQLTPREFEEFNQQKEMFELQARQQLALKDREIELARLEAKWSAWLKLPLVIITLPVRVLFAFGYLVHAVRKTEPSEAFWRFMR